MRDQHREAAWISRYPVGQGRARMRRYSIPAEAVIEIKAALRDDLAELIRADLGEPSGKTGKDLRWGAKGSLSLVLAGPKRGQWFDHEAGEGGDAVEWLTKRRGLSYVEALQWGADRYGIDTGHDLTEQERIDQGARWEAGRRQRQEQEAAREAKARDEAARAEAHHKAAADRYWQTCLPIEAGSPADLYLTHTRAIPRPVDGWPATVIRFQPAERALVIGLADDTGHVLSAQRIFLTQGGTRALQEGEDGKPVKRPKLMLPGSSGGLFFKLPAREAVMQGCDPALFLAATEGPETALSVWMATGLETWASIGAGGNINPPVGRTILHCRDDDAEGSAAHNAADRAQNRWKSEHHTVLTVWPWPHRRGDKSDLNDTLQAEGTDAVRERVSSALDELGEMQKRVGLPVSDARTQMGEHVARFMSEARSYIERVPGGYAAAVRAEQKAAEEEGRPENIEAIPKPKAYALQVTTGAGKSALTLREIARLVRELPEIGGAVVFSCPTVELADEQAASFAAIAPDISHRVYRGRGQIDPDAPAPESDSAPTRMCHNLPEAQRIEKLGLRVTATLCHATIKDPETSEKANVCPFRAQCGYERQRAASGVQVWFVAHAVMFNTRPSCIGPIALHVVDETIERTGIDPRRFVTSPNAEGWTVPDWIRMEARHDFPALFSHLHGAGRFDKTIHLRSHILPNLLALNGVGPIRRETLEGMGLGVPELMEYLDAEKALGASGDGLPGPLTPSAQGVISADPDTKTRENARAVCSRASRHIRGVLARCLRLMNERTVASGRLRAQGEEPWGSDPVEFVAGGADDVSAGFIAPTLLLSATLSLELLRHRWPGIEMLGEIRAAAPHLRIEQSAKFSWGKAAFFNYADDANAGKPTPKAATFSTLLAMLRRESRTARKVLAVLQKSVEEELHLYAEARGGLPGNLETAHFNAVAGLNRWGPGADEGGVDLVVIVGQPTPPPDTVEAMAEALTGEAIDRLGWAQTRSGQWFPNWYPEEDGARVMANGAMIAATRQAHPNPTADAFLRSIVEGEIVQAIGRARGVNRTEDNPCRVLVLGRSVLPLPVSEVSKDARYEPTPYDLMASEGGIVFESGTDAGRFYCGTIWGEPGDTSENARRKAEDAAKAAIKEYRGRKGKWGKIAPDGKPEVRENPLYIGSLLGILPDLGPDWISVRYRGAGAGKRSAQALIDLRRLGLDEARARIEAAIGPLALFNVEQTERDEMPSTGKRENGTKNAPSEDRRVIDIGPPVGAPERRVPALVAESSEAERDRCSGVVETANDDAPDMSPYLALAKRMYGRGFPRATVEKGCLVLRHIRHGGLSDDARTLMGASLAGAIAFDGMALRGVSEAAFKADMLDTLGSDHSRLMLEGMPWLMAGGYGHGVEFLHRMCVGGEGQSTHYAPARMCG